MGAGVIKVEAPGDHSSRRIRTFGDKGTGAGKHTGAAFLYHNTNKLGLSLDPTGQEGGPCFMGSSVKRTC